MGNGVRNGDRLDFQVTANYALSNNDKTWWRNAFSKASELLWNASNGQLKFGTIFVTENNAASNLAEFFLDPSVTGRPFGSFGGWGNVGSSIFLPASSQEGVLFIVHELGHHVWSLGDEYARANSATIDKDASLPSDHGNLIIPITSAGSKFPDGDFAGADAIILFEGKPLETREISNKTGNRISVTTSFSENPKEGLWLLIQWTDDVECTGDRSTGACIMEFGGTSAGRLDRNTGNWTPAANPVTEFCTAANHSKDNQQDDLRMEACWKTITKDSDFMDLDAPEPGPSSTVEPSGWTPPEWVNLDDEVRLALVLDRSGSMNLNDGARLAGVKTGAQFWIENAAVENDLLTIVWYSNDTILQLPLSNFGTLNQATINVQINEIQSRTASGSTNILASLQDALGQLTGRATGASVQASLLITDGAHNTPPGTSMLSIVPEYRKAHTSIYTLGVGQGSEMDIAGLRQLAQQTGGTAMTAGDGSDANAIQDALIEINAIIRGGMLSSDGSGGSDTRRAPDNLDGLVKQVDVDPCKRPSLRDITCRYCVTDWRDAIRNTSGKTPTGRFSWFGLEIEEGVKASTFTLSHDTSALYWMYLIDPTGREYRATDDDVLAWNWSRAYEFAKIRKPVAGIWTVLGLRLDRGAAVHVKSIVAIDHAEISAYANAERRGINCPIKLSAGARYVETLTGLSVQAFILDTNGHYRAITLHDNEGDGRYEGWVDFPVPRPRAAFIKYNGYVEIRAPKNPPVANFSHAVLHAETEEEIGDFRVKSPRFVRHVPITLTLGELPTPPQKEPEGGPVII